MSGSGTRISGLSNQINIAEIRSQIFSELAPTISNCEDSCCLSEFLDEELEIVDESFSQMDGFTTEEMASIYYVCGYIAFKLGRSYASRETHNLPPESEFQVLVSRGRLCHPCEPLLSFAKCCYFVFKKVIQEHDRNSRCAFRVYFYV